MGASRRGREHRSSDIIHIIMGIVFSVISFFFFPLTRPSHGTIGGLSVQPNRPFLIIHRTLLCTRRQIVVEYCLYNTVSKQTSTSLKGQRVYRENSAERCDTGAFYTHTHKTRYTPMGWEKETALYYVICIYIYILQYIQRERENDNIYTAVTGMGANGLMCPPGWQT